MKKIDLQNIINNNIRSNPSLIDKTEHADVNDLELENSYGDIVSEQNTSFASSRTNTTISSTGKWYLMDFVKQGRKVSVNGYIQNKTASILSNEVFFTITGVDFLMPTFVPLLGNIYINGVNTSNGSGARCELKNNIFTLLSPLGVDQKIEFNFEYFTKD